MATKKPGALEILSENLRALMSARGNEHLSTGPKLAAVSGVSQKTINNIEERRHIPKLDSIERLAKAFKIEPYMLLVRAEDAGFRTVCKAYSLTDAGGREFLIDMAVTLIRKIDDRGQDSEGQRA